MVFQEWLKLKVLRASPNYSILFKQSKKNIFIFKIKNNFTTTWNKIKDDSTVFLLGYIFWAPINYNSLGWVIIPPFFDDHNSVRLKKQRSRRLRVWSRIEIEHFTRQSFTETNWNTKHQTANFICKLLSSWW